MFLFPKKNKKIKALACISLFIFSALFLSKCEEENARPRTYPRVNTMPVSDITEKGATFNAEIYSLGSESIIDHGFVWGVTDNPTINNNKILLGSIGITGAYSAPVLSTLLKDKLYTVKTFVQTAEHFVYGAPVTFKSLGSGAPVIYGFEPDSAAWMDTLLVKGKNFSWVENENIVRLNQLQCETISSTDTTLSVLVNKELSELSTVLSVELAGNKAICTNGTFRLIPPVIKNIIPMQARWGDTITVTGENFQNRYSNNTISATISGFPAKIIEKGKDSLLLIVPEDLVTITNILSIKINSLILPLSENMILLSPVISGIYPKEGTWGTIITLKGKFHPQQARNLIKIGGFTPSIVSSNKDSISIYAPDELTEHNNLVINTSNPFVVVSPDTFKLFAPYIESITPLTGFSYSYVVIKGKYFIQNYGGSTTVKFGSANAGVVDVSGSLISCIVPFPISNGPVNITVTVGSQSTVYKDPYIVINPVITNVYPLSGTFNDEITLEGENLEYSSLGVTFTDNGEYGTHRDAEIVSASSNKLVVKVPLTLDSVPKRLEIFAIYNILATYTVHDFILSPPEILLVSPAVLTQGQDITISGNDFNPLVSGNEVFWGIHPLTVKSATAKEIVASIPLDIPPGNNKISVKVGGYIRYYPVIYEIK
jgi:IPT/TIG domain